MARARCDARSLVFPKLVMLSKTLAGLAENGNIAKQGSDIQAQRLSPDFDECERYEIYETDSWVVGKSTNYLWDSPVVVQDEQIGF